MKIDRVENNSIVSRGGIAEGACCGKMDLDMIKERDLNGSLKLAQDNTCCHCNCTKLNSHKTNQLRIASDALDLSSLDENRLRQIQETLQDQRASELEAATMLVDQSTLLYQNRQVKVITCADVYDNWRHYKRFYKRKAPKNGLEFKIDYLDTGVCMSEKLRAQAPIVLALHGAPGSYKDFAQLIQHLNRQQVRVIAPNFPDYTATVETGVLFRHSGDEKAAYLRDFLQAIQVHKIDLLVSHSSAIFPTLLLLLNGDINDAGHLDSGESSDEDSDSELESDWECAENSAEISRKAAKRHSKKQKSHEKDARRRESAVKFEQPIEIGAVALLNPAGHRMPKSMKPTWFKCGAVQCYQQKLGRYWFRKLGPAFLTVVGVPVKVDNMDNVMLSATVMRNSKCRRVKRQLKLLSARKIPTLLVFSENDKLIEKEIFYEMTQFMGMEESKFDTYDDRGQLERSQSDAADWCRVMVFKAGGHYAYSNYPKIVNQAVSELLTKRLASKSIK